MIPARGSTRAGIGFRVTLGANFPVHFFARRFWRGFLWTRRNHSRLNEPMNTGIQ